MESERLLWEKISIYRERRSDEIVQKKSIESESLHFSLELFFEIIPYLGVYKEIMKEIRVHLIEAIYGENITVVTQNESDSNNYVSRCPYFDLYRNLLRKCSKENEMFEEKLYKLNEKLQEEMEGNENYSNMCVEKDGEIDNLNEQIDAYQKNIYAIQNEIKYEQQSKLELSLEKNDIISEMSNKMEKLEKFLEKEKNKVIRLKEYENGYKTLSKKFSSIINEDNNNGVEDENGNVKSYNMDNCLTENIKSLKMMSNDLLVLENVLLKDYENQREDLKKIIIEQSKLIEMDDDIPDIETQDVVAQLGELTASFSKTKTFFWKNFTKVITERKEIESRILDITDTMKENEELETSNKFIPELQDIKQMYQMDEAALNLYSAILYYSTNNGKTFYDSPESRYCVICRAQTAICPHNIQQQSKIISLPKGCSHIMLKRPPLKGVQSEESSMETELGEPTSYTMKFRKSVLLPDHDEFLLFEELVQYYPKRKYPRKLSEAYILSIFEDFWGEILLDDELELDIENAYTTRERLRLFFVKQCKLNRPSQLMYTDYLSNLIEIAANYPILLLFCHVLLGNVDAAIMRYLFLLVDCISVATLDCEDTLRFFFETLYPFLEEDGIDNLVLSYISYSENCFTRENIENFMLANLIKSKDPRIIMVATQASEMGTQFEDAFNVKEYNVLLETVSYLPNKKLSDRIFYELVTTYEDVDNFKIAPVSKISQAVALVSFLEVFDNVKTKLVEYDSAKGSTLNKDNDMRWSFTRIKRIASLLRGM